MRNSLAVVLFSMSLLSCASGPPVDRECSPTHPCIGCIAPTMNQQSHVEGKLLPEVVRVIGVSSPEDGERWMVLRSGEQDTKKWQPWDRNAIAFGARCGPESRAFDELFQTDKEPKP